MYVYVYVHVYVYVCVRRLLFQAVFIKKAGAGDFWFTLQPPANEDASDFTATWSQRWDHVPCRHCRKDSP